MYYLFAGEVYYALGGVKDFVSACTDLEVLVKATEKYDKKGKWWQIIDSNMSIVKQSELEAYGYW